MVQGQPPRPQRDQDKGDDCGTQEKEDRAAPILIDGAAVLQIESFKFRGVHITNTLSWSTHTKTVVKRARQKVFPLKRRFGMGPQILKRFYSCTIESITRWLHHCLVWQLLSLRLQGTTEGSANGPVHHWAQASCHPGLLYQAVSEDGPKNCQTPATLVIDCSLCYRTASGTRTSSLLGPRGF